MVTLDDKFAHFSKSVLEKARQTCEDHLRIVDGKNEEALRAFKAEVEEKAAELKAKSLHQAQYEKKMIISRAQLTRKRQVMALKDELMEKLMHRIRLELEAFVGTSDYGEYLKKGLMQYQKTFLEMDGLVLKLRDEDRVRFQGELESTIEALAPSLRGNIQYESLPDEMIGGMVLLNDKQTIRFDLTLQTLLEDRRGAIGEMLHETFDKAGMSNE